MTGAPPATVGPPTDFEVLGRTRTAEGDLEVYLVEVRVPVEMYYFQGHFDGRPILPAVVQLNTLVLAQIQTLWPVLGHLQRVTKLKFRRPVFPGDVLVLRLERKAAATRVVFTLARAGESVALGTLDFRDGGP